MNTTLRNSFVVAFGLGSAVYWAIASWLGGPVMTEVGNGLLMGVAVGVLASWWRTSWESFKRGGDEGADQLKVGIFGTFLWLGVAQRLWGSIIRWTDYDPVLIGTPVLGYVLTMGALSGVFFLSAPGATAGTIPIHNRWWIMVAIALGSGFAGVMFGTAWTSVAERNPLTPIVSIRPTCYVEAPIKISAAGKIHEPGSFWYDSVTPKECFRSVDAAKADHFTLPGPLSPRP